ncbi:MAG: 30S ribosomal protein S20 [Legionellales bacterium]|nr:30S ribosomal protein S20 [Legionellales bacterium]
MANTNQALKRARQANAHRSTKRWQISRANTQIKNTLQAIEAKDNAGAVKAYQAMCSMLDKLTSKGFMHKNKVARHKSRIASRLAVLQKSA